VLEYPPSSPDVAPSDFILFPKIKEILKGMHFNDTDDVRSNMIAALKAIPQNQFQNCFERWTRHGHRCIASQGEYFEGDNSDIQHITSASKPAAWKYFDCCLGHFHACVSTSS
jgi:hypothetical protein